MMCKKGGDESMGIVRSFFFATVRQQEKGERTYRDGVT